MSDIQRRSSSRMTRSQKQQRAYRLVMASGAAGVVAVVGLILAIAGVLGSGLWIIAAIVAVVCFLLFRRTVSS